MAGAEPVKLTCAFGSLSAFVLSSHIARVYYPESALHGEKATKRKAEEVA